MATTTYINIRGVVTRRHQHPGTASTSNARLAITIDTEGTVRAGVFVDNDSRPLNGEIDFQPNSAGEMARVLSGLDG